MDLRHMKWLDDNYRKGDSLESLLHSASPTVLSSVTECATAYMSDVDSFQESSDHEAEEFVKHCFKRQKFAEKHPNAFWKVKSSRFGPAPPRRRIIIAPPMEGESLPRAKPRLLEPLDPKPKTSAVKEEPKEVAEAAGEEDEDIDEDEVRELGAWIEERKKLQNLLNTCADVEPWLVRKKSKSEQEDKRLREIVESRQVKKAQLKAKTAATSSIEKLLPAKKPKRIFPLIKAPYPECLITLQKFLHKQKLSLVDLFSKEDRYYTRRFKRADFIRVLEGINVPLSRNELEDVVVYLTSTRRGNYITMDDLVKCQKIWIDYLKEQLKHAKEAKPEELPPTDQSNLLEVPPINTEPDRMHLTYNKMEEVGKRYKQMRRHLKKKITPLEWAENGQMVKSGDPVVDAHCTPSTLPGDTGELVDKYRRDSHLAWFRCVKYFEKHGGGPTEKTLQRVLLHPGDKLINREGSTHKIRQPGGFYENWALRGSVSESTSQKSLPRKKKGLQEQPKIPPKEKEREMRKTFGFLNPKTNPNNFWPGHLLDKQRLYPPQMERYEGEATFSRVSSTRPVYPATYHPHRNWPISEQRFVNNGDPSARKAYHL